MRRVNVNSPSDYDDQGQRLHKQKRAHSPMQVVYERPQRPPVNKFELKRFENRVRKDYDYELKCLVIDSLVENWDQNIR